MSLGVSFRVFSRLFVCLFASFRVFSCLFVSFRIFSHYSILKSEKTRKDTKRHQQYIRSRLIRVYSHCIMSLGVSFRVFSCLFASFRVFSHFSILNCEKPRKDTNNTLDPDLFVSIRIVLCLLRCLFVSFCLLV